MKENKLSLAVPNLKESSFGPLALVWFGLVLVLFGIVQIRLCKEYNGPWCSRKYFLGGVGWVVFSWLGGVKTWK